VNISGRHPDPVRRVSLGDGQPPAYVFTSPCCGKPSLVPAWMVEYARTRTDGRLQLECGRHTTDPLRPVGSARAEGCGRRYTVQLDPAPGE
jgi:hypothetical protein